MIVLDEHLQGVGIEGAIARWYRGRVCFITELRPNIVIKDEMIPHLLRTVSQPTFVTLNWRHFWERIRAHDDYCIVCLTLSTGRATETPQVLRRLLHLDGFRTKADRMGKVIRVSEGQVAYYTDSSSSIQIVSLP
jgi:hypothetical protein